MQIQAEILRQHMPVEDVVQQCAIAWAEQQRVMRHVRVCHARPEIPDEQAHRIPRPLQLFVRPAAAMPRRDQVAIGPGRIGVRDDDVCRDAFAGNQHDTGGGSIDHRYLPNFGIASHGVALAGDEAAQALHEFTGATHREMHAPVTLQERDQAVDRTGGKRIAADRRG